MKEQKYGREFSSTKAISIVIVSIIVGGGAYFLLIRNQPSQQDIDQPTNDSSVISTNSPFLLVVHTEELASEINATQLRLYDIQSQKLSSLSMYDKKGALTQDANSIFSKIPKEPTLSFGQFGANGPGAGKSIYPEVKDKIGQGMAIHEYSISPDGNFVIFNIFKDLFEVCEENRLKNVGGAEYDGDCLSPESSDVNTFYIYSKIDKSVTPFNSIKNLPIRTIFDVIRVAWSPDSNTLYLISTGTDLKFHAIDWNTRAYTKTYSVSPVTTLIYHNPSIETFAVSHDRSKIALSIVWRGQHQNYSLWQQLQPKSTYSFYSESDLYIFDINTGKTSKVITSGSGYETSGIAWSPDDSKVVANVWWREPKDVTKLEVFDTKSLKLIWSTAENEFPSLPFDLNFSPDSVYMAYSTNSIEKNSSVSVIKFNNNAVTDIPLPFSIEERILFDGWVNVER
ncbi:hypothetical protein A3H65_00525 [Candidatus Giovannonibacteria bacterium RIFCSPLOWO2_02_FULL_45_14]|uniref:Uncharacterized protein n=1 Tax=Candidatus Giovannonibacteria bacterium RIFCSPLOWO2_12_FULL_44_15 TaxID=1798364 RepID=A0A1F5Y0Z4_9BACT|nr:MAG: hypothetical protein A3C75_01665 [Candidatus Giovannonibacteria bacterium RIFCSPHIGHO2_02_FULL_44_31]OGF75887.1 MAG: hypothetical protein A3E62_00640 [Candidatus Giovannonibacteria bacterium RIFCSPHIGHO2_12_FULL_44_29]OGF91213.1 MAG: hypothetical protein A3H65_00525 [Candidatus Giovannonibacteria bacterium RIFCSPLOWO2_02_FULL_45_14]OGF93501.1 MAG: hypothetical protein A3G54_00685 [Candidatus Giovannonibacteria bacterium RIFCSPLOWO2_12_FULL_44_15]